MYDYSKHLSIVSHHVYESSYKYNLKCEKIAKNNNEMIVLRNF